MVSEAENGRGIVVPHCVAPPSAPPRPRSAGSGSSVPHGPGGQPNGKQGVIYLPSQSKGCPLRRQKSRFNPQHCCLLVVRRWAGGSQTLSWLVPLPEGVGGYLPPKAVRVTCYDVLRAAWHEGGACSMPGGESQGL